MLGPSRRFSPVTLLSADSTLDSPHRVKKINHYILRAKLGSGSSSAVYLGIHDQTDEKFALKRIRLRDLARTSAGIAQLEREIRLMKMFHHPHIIRIHEVLHLSASDEVYLILEYADKGCLGGFIDRGVHLAQPTIFSIIKQVLHGLKYLHDSGYVHQDIKPCNILLTESGVAKLADFGIGHSFDSAAMVVGSPAFQAPEALDDSYVSDDDSDSSTEGPQKEDIWALGVTLYQLLFLDLPFIGDNLFEVVNYIKEHPLAIPESCDVAVAELVSKMLTVDPGKRISVDELLRHPLIAEAPEFAENLPTVPLAKINEGEILEMEAKVCGDGYSFAAIPLSVPRRFSQHVYRADAGPPVVFGRPKIGRGPRHSDGDDEEADGMRPH
jgi:serine/threonine-protein kinase 11